MASSRRKPGSGWNMEEKYTAYILTTRKNTVLYTGVTNDVRKRVEEHRQAIGSKFTKKYNVNKLVYTENYKDIHEAIHREKCIKEWQRKWKVELIEKVNPNWDELLSAE